MNEDEYQRLRILGNKDAFEYQPGHHSEPRYTQLFVEEPTGGKSYAYATGENRGQDAFPKLPSREELLRELDEELDRGPLIYTTLGGVPPWGTMQVQWAEKAGMIPPHHRRYWFYSKFLR